MITHSIFTLLGHPTTEGWRSTPPFLKQKWCQARLPTNHLLWGSTGIRCRYLLYTREPSKLGASSSKALSESVSKSLQQLVKGDLGMQCSMRPVESCAHSYNNLSDTIGHEPYLAVFFSCRMLTLDNSQYNVSQLLWLTLICLRGWPCAVQPSRRTILQNQAIEAAQLAI